MAIRILSTSRIGRSLLIENDATGEEQTIYVQNGTYTLPENFVVSRTAAAQYQGFLYLVAEDGSVTPIVPATASPNITVTPVDNSGNDAE